VLARSSTKDLTVILRLTGPIGGPKIELTSEPALPTEEILSRFLFGREAARITPLQAVQLANALNTIGGGKFFDPLRPARQWLGLDALDIGESGAGSGEVALGVGKYLGERVYIRAERGVGAKSGKVSVEVEITPYISLKTEVGEDAEAGVGINWKWSY
jgi:translocation and assembly module TamB